MAIQTSTRLIGDPGIPTQLEVDDETGATEVYSLVGGQKRLIATSAGEDWVIKTRFKSIYNNANLDLEIDRDLNEVRDIFNTEFVEDYNLDRARLINTHSTDDVKK